MKNKVFAFWIVFSLLFAVLSMNVLAQKEESLKPLVLNEYSQDSFLIDKETGQKWELKEFKEKKPKLISGHKIEVSLYFERVKDASVIPSTYCLGITSNLISMSVNFADVEVKQGDNVTIWDKEEYHRWEHFTITIEGYVPDPKVTLKGYSGEPHFENIEVEGIGNKEVYISIVVYKNIEKTERDSEFDMITFYATNTTLENLKKDTEDNLVSISNNVNVLKSIFPYQNNVTIGIENKFQKVTQDIANLSSNGHPGWAFTISTDLKDATESLSGLKKPEIRTLVHSMNKDEIKELGSTIKDLPVEYQKLIYPSKTKNYILLLILAIVLCIGGIFFGYNLKKIPVSHDPEIKKAIEDIDETINGITKLRNVLATSKAKEAQDAIKGLWEADKKLSSAKNTLKLLLKVH